MNTSGESSPPGAPNSNDSTTNGSSRGALRRSLISSALSLGELVKVISNAAPWPSKYSHVRTEHLIRPRDFQELDLALLMVRQALETAEQMAREMWDQACAAELAEVEQQMREMGMEPTALDPLTPSSPSAERSST